MPCNTNVYLVTDHPAETYRLEASPGVAWFNTQNQLDLPEVNPHSRRDRQSASRMITRMAIFLPICKRAISDDRRPSSYDMHLI